MYLDELYNAPGNSCTCINWLVGTKSYKFKPSALIIKTSCLMEHTWWVISICIYHFAGQFWEDFQCKCGTSGFEVGMSCCEVQLTFQRGDGILQQQLQSWVFMKHSGKHISWILELYFHIYSVPPIFLAWFLEV